jgi:hypothetical protein
VAASTPSLPALAMNIGIVLGESGAALRVKPSSVVSTSTLSRTGSGSVCV